MTTFQVTYSTRDGRKREMEVTADSPSAARQLLRKRGILPTILVRKDNRTTPTRVTTKGERWQDLFEEIGRAHV